MNLKELRQRFQEDKLPRQLKDPKKEARDLIFGNITVITITKDGKRKEIDKKDLQRWKDDGWKLAEEAPANSAGGGNIAGIGVGPDGEPGIQPKWAKEYKKKNKEGLKGRLTTFLNKFRTVEDYNKLEVENLINKIDGNADVTDNQIKPIVSNLKRKKENGTYNENVGIKTFRYVVDNQINTIVSEGIRNRVAGVLLKKYL